MKARLFILSSLLLFTAACGTEKAATKDEEAKDPNGSEQLAENVSQSRQGNEKVTEYDLNRDKKPDVFVFTVPAKTDEGRDFDRLVRKEMDLNWDGRVDISRTYDQNEQIESEKIDLDFDGKLDQENFYEKGVIVRKQRDIGYTGKPNTWIFYEKGKIVRKERDNDGNGKIDYWEYWENDQIDRFGEDLDGDGNVDRWTKNPNSSAE
jgi:antitoxin component YwqK of YwqJK toxin-antitoxin module